MRGFIPALLAAVTAGSVATAAPEKLLNVSYDVSRELYKDFNGAFVEHWKRQTGNEVVIDVSHGGSSKQARAVADGLEADVVTMNQETDVNLLASQGLVSADWKQQFPDNSSPYTSTIVFLVRKGNPKGIRDWGDLVKGDVQVIVPNPKTSGNGRYSYLAAWAWAKEQPGGGDATAQQFVADLFRRVPVLDTGGRAASTTFIERGIGDVLLTFESEVLQITGQFSPDKFDVVTPSVSILAEFPVAVVSAVVDKRGTRPAATEYLRYLWSDEGQRIIVKHYLRPRDMELLASNRAIFPDVKLVAVEEAFGGWSEAQKEHFNDGGIFDRISQPGARKP
ncbi:MAG: sulfate ABC transporter substrate-binding protein [Chthoniobacterales bacterium]|nr:sulfate ABC transporter substrate-binding protein [Chthoniobacterales bacterium]